MTTRRRDFLKIFSGGMLSAAALVAGRSLGEFGEELPSIEPPEAKPQGTLWKTETFPDGVVNQSLEFEKTPICADSVNTDKPRKYEVSEKLLILRIAHDVSVWCKKGLVNSGEWFCHHEGSRRIEKCFGSSLICDRIEFVGAKAMRWKELKHGMMPVNVTTDMNDPLFKEIMNDADIGIHRGGGYWCMYGPVYKLWAAPDFDETEPYREFELFCCNKSMRRFAQAELGHEGINQTCYLNIKTMTHPTHGWKWFCPAIQGIN